MQPEPGDVIDWPVALDGIGRGVETISRNTVGVHEQPVEVMDFSNKHGIPCTFCNPLDRVVERGEISADYILKGTEQGTIVAATCEACIDGARPPTEVTSLEGWNPIPTDSDGYWIWEWDEDGEDYVIRMSDEGQESNLGHYTGWAVNIEPASGLGLGGRDSWWYTPFNCEDAEESARDRVDRLMKRVADEPIALEVTYTATYSVSESGLSAGAGLSDIEQRAKNDLYEAIEDNPRNVGEMEVERCD